MDLRRGDEVVVAGRAGERPAVFVGKLPSGRFLVQFKTPGVDIVEAHEIVRKEEKR